MALFKSLLGSAVLLCLIVPVTGLTKTLDEPVYYRVAYDNCGAPGKQSHVQVGSGYTYPARDIPMDKVAANDPARTVAFDATHVVLRYEGVPAGAACRLALTLLSDAARRQTIYVNDEPVASHFELKPAQVVRMQYQLPERLCAQGRLEVRIEHESGPNAVVSEATLYATAERLEPVLSLVAFGNLDREIRGRIIDLNNDSPVSNVSVTASVSGTNLLLSTDTDRAGEFRFTIPSVWQGPARKGLLVQATLAASRLKQTIDALELFPPQLIPKPTRTGRVRQPILSLVGTWKFNPVPPQSFPQDSDTVSDWADIQVPGEWVMQGFDVPKGQAAGYFREFDVPADFRNSRIILHCDAVYADAEIWINQSRVGAHAGGMTAFQLDITDQVKAGRTNSIAMKVINDTQADVLASGSQYAVHALGGMTRKLYVQAVPRVAVAGFDVSTTFDTAYRDADIHLALAVENTGAFMFDHGQLTFTLYDADGHPVDLTNPTLDLKAVAPGTRHAQVVTLPVSRPRQWDPEHPHLYVLEGRLHVGSRVLEVVRRRFGFRQVEIRGDQVFVNNHPIKLHGVCRHEVDPLRGRSLTPEQWRRDAELFRAANVNYIRTSHYPPAEEFLDACDELGLFVECEAPLCWVQHGANANWGQPGWNYLDPNLYLPLLRANLESITFNRRHPSIIIWSLANESRWSPLWAKVLEAVEQFDPTRLTSFHDQCYGGYNNAGSTAKIANMHYPGPRGPAQAATQDRPLLFGEYCHLNAYNRYELVTDPGLRNAWGRGFKAMWDKIYKTPGCLGGALWSGIDDTFHLPSGETVGYGTWGPIDGWRRPKPEYYHIKKTYSPVRISVAHLDAPDMGDTLILPVENRHDFTNLKELDILWRIGDTQGQTQADIEPRQSGQLRIKTGLTSLDGKVLHLTFSRSGRGVIDEYALPVGTDQKPTEIAANVKGEPLALETQGDTIEIQGRGFALDINRSSGQIARAVYHGAPVLEGGPELMILPLNGRGGTQMTKQAQTFAPYTDVCADRQVDSVTTKKQAGHIVIEVRDRYTQASGGYTLDIDPGGQCVIEYTYEVLQAVNPRQWGMVFAVARGLDTLDWQRKGMWTVYPKDHIGRLTGTAKALVGHAFCGPAGPRVRPDYPWSEDSSPLGTNDFRATKENIYHAALTNRMGHSVSVVSDGSQHVRTWIDGPRIRLLVAQYSNAGAEGFFRSHASVEDRPLKVGDTVQGTIHLELK